MLSSAQAVSVSVEQPVLAIHGSAGSGVQWQALAAHCPFQGGFHAPDLVGYGKRTIDADYRAERTLEARIAPLMGWLDQQVHPVSLVAHSFGATVALEVLRARPDACRSLVFYEPVVPAVLKHRGSERDGQLLGELAALAQLLEGTRASVGMESFMNYWCNCDAWSRFSPGTRQQLAGQAGTVADDFRQALALPAERLDELRRCIPLSLLVGSDTLPIAMQMTRKLAGLFASSSVTSVAGLGHLGVFTDPAAVNPLIHQALLRAAAA